MNDNSDSNVNSVKELENLALNVLKQYSIVPSGLSLIQGGTVKTVWRLSSQGRLLCLKRLKQTLDKAEFSVNAQIYIKKSGGKVPGIILNKNRKPITIYEDQLFVLYEWIEGKDLNFDIPSDLHQALQGLAAFHIASKGYCPGDNSRVSTKLGKWPEQYTSMKNKLAAWKELADKKVSQPHYQAYSKFTVSMLELADQALNEIGKSAYADLIKEGSSSIVLCHQDFGKGNVIAAPNGVYVLDLDGVTFDLPARDLRKIIGKNAQNKGQWQLDTIKDILNCYSEINALNFAETQVLYIDMLFPHWYYGLVKNLFQNDKPVKASEIERIAKLEESKVPLIKSLLRTIKPV